MTSRRRYRWTGGVITDYWDEVFADDGLDHSASLRERLEEIVDEWLALHGTGTACVIGDAGFASRARVRSLTSELAKGLEFDLVVLVDPAGWGGGVQGAVDRYVAMTRATQQLAILEARPAAGRKASALALGQHDPDARTAQR